VGKGTVSTVARLGGQTQIVLVCRVRERAVIFFVDFGSISNVASCSDITIYIYIYIYIYVAIMCEHMNIYA